ncbi:MAG: hypothetical protein B6D77_18625 [gamma proteobacterium symbiont of Ctena orbiculata]|nr:MAG: hypothetical protein B6D77_18625 [gamma proteobacterium symbiont of Ctena orbiculata]
MSIEKQAVLMIHGIGNQRPMETLWSFVETVWSDHKAIHNEFAGSHVWSKPDYVSNNFELRRLTTPQNSAGIKTDFFEFYWAHLMHGTGYGHLIGWLISLLWRKPSSVPPGLISAFYTLWIIVGIAVGGWVFMIGEGLANPDGPGLLERLPYWVAVILTIAGTLAVAVLGFLMKEVVGDAARYLRPAAQNIQRRQEIRTAGVDILKQLHDRGYDRIILVGHSLGSVIGYDILSHAFHTYNVPTKAAGEAHTAHDAMEKIAQDASDGNAADIDAVQQAQRGYFNEFTDPETINGRWRVTDFITLGSPLAHASVLLAHDDASLAQKVTLREYPSCLPSLEQKIRTTDALNRHFSYGPMPSKTNDKEVKIPHHAALFSMTRWTNLYFPCKAILFGDLIGGPISTTLGREIRNMPVGTKIRNGFLTHRFYWKATDWRPEANDTRQETVTALRDVLDLVDKKSFKSL